MDERLAGRDDATVWQAAQTAGRTALAARIEELFRTEAVGAMRGRRHRREAADSTTVGLAHRPAFLTARSALLVGTRLLGHALAAP